MTKRIAIVGGGPAGLSLAKLLEKQRACDVTVFEADTYAGGKSFSVIRGEAVVEMGTCYLTNAHRIVKHWMNETDIHLSSLKEQSFDGENFMNYIKRGAGPSLAVQVARFLAGRRKLMRALEADPVPEWALNEAAEPIADWLRHRGLDKIERFMHRSLTNLGYGFVDETPTVQAMRWNDADLIITGVLKQLQMPVEGWTEFWTRLADGLDVRTGHRVSRIERDDTGIRLTFNGGETFEADHLVCAIPIDDFVRLTEPTELEAEIASAITWNGYTTTLVGMERKFTHGRVEAYSRAVVPGADYGRLMSARYEGYEPDLGGHLYLTGQLSGTYSDEELVELLRGELLDVGGPINAVILQRTWKYFARYDSAAIRSGLLTKLDQAQGQQNTWYTGAAWSHEAVSNIVNFNAGLAHKLQLSVKA